MASQLDNVVRLSYREKVPVGTMKEIVAAALQERLQGAQYEGEKCGEAARGLADTIRNRLKNLGYDRYKFCVQVLIGERRDQGVRCENKVVLLLTQIIILIQSLTVSRIHFLTC